jgi:uncharacterized delta-60 repeat protein
MNSGSIEDFHRIAAPTGHRWKLLALLSCWAVSSLGLVSAAIYPSNCVDSAGTKDQTFYRPPEPHEFTGASLSTVELSSGKILVALQGIYVGGLSESIERSLLVRLHADGTLDPSFVFDDSNFERVWAAHAFAVSSNGSLAVATSGYGTEGFFYGHFHVSRSDGSNVFSTYTSIDHSALVRALAWDGEGRVVIGGNYTPFHEGMLGGIARLNGDGSLDPTFLPTTNFSFVVGLAVQPDGKVLVLDTGGTLEGGRLYRLLPGGSLDGDFSPVHFNTSFVDPNPHPPVPIVLQPDSKILVAGPFTAVNGTSRHSVARLNSNGSLDMGFDPGDGAAGGRPEISLALQQDGKVLVAGGFTSFNGTDRSGVVRLHRDGSVDTTFDAENQFGYVGSVTVLRSGRLLVTDYVDFFGGSMALHRLFGDPAVQMFPPAILGPNQLALEFTSVPGVPYVLQQSTALTAWQSVSTNTASACTHRFTNGMSGAATFFRVQRQD